MSKKIDLTGLAHVYSKIMNIMDSKLSTVYKHKGSIASVADLPSENMSVGDVYNIETAGQINYIGDVLLNKPIVVNAGANVVWTGSGWDVLGGEVTASTILGSNSVQFTGGNANS